MNQDQIDYHEESSNPVADYLLNVLVIYPLLFIAAVGFWKFLAICFPPYAIPPPMIP